MRDDWVNVTFDAVGKIYSGGTPKTSNREFWGDKIAWISPADLSKYTNKFISKGAKSISQMGLEKSSAKLIPAGSVLFSSRAPIGYVAIAKNELATNQGFKSIFPRAGIFNEYIFYYLKASKNLAENNASGTTFKEISKKAFSGLPFPLAPLPEQRAIVAKIEGLFSDLDQGIADLKTAQAQLKIYRQAVLKKAFEGELTKVWREQQTSLPSAAELLSQIKEERQKHYDQQVEKWNADILKWDQKGKEGKKPKKPTKEKSFTSYETEIELHKLPSCWNWSDLGEITAVSGGLTKNSKRSILNRQVPFLRVANVYFNRLKLDDMHLIGIKMDEISRVSLKYGDLLLVEGNGSVGQIGRAAIWKDEIKNCVHQNHLIKARPCSSIKSAYLLHFLCSKKGRDLIIHTASSTSGLHTLNLTKVCNLKIPLCSLAEQHQIVREIETRLSVCDEVEGTIFQALKKAEALRQSILKKAFEGRLLSEAELSACRAEPDWESAAALLARIQAEK